MLLSLVLAAVTAAAASPVPQPSATPALKTIVSVRSNSRCAEIITHANTAITATLSNDVVLSRAISALHYTNLDDGNPIHRRNNLNALGDMAKTLMQQSRSGDDEVKRLRKLAEQSKDPAEAKQLKQFADELGGALWRQQKIARDINGLLAYQDFKEMTTWNESDRQMNQATFGVPDPQAQLPADVQPHDSQGRPYNTMRPELGHDPNEPTATQQLKNAANDFTQRIPDIVRDESNAAGHVDGALAGCSAQP
ncbi:MAG TPA: hypothetical protein VFL13_14575 [Candidatus Baltobacteraceae bacterium]|nr:hypothetical protein [Candidatus Baltobacteraceae bacterium]